MRVKLRSGGGRMCQRQGVKGIGGRGAKNIQDSHSQQGFLGYIGGQGIYVDGIDAEV